MVKIFVEGKSDKKFIECLIKSRLDKKEVTDFGVDTTEGWNGLDKVKAKIQEYNDLGFKVLVIFDADNDYKERLEYIEKFRTDNQMVFDIFLFPDNKSNGELETLLEQIVNDNHKDVLQCFQVYEDCLKSLGQQRQFTYNSPTQKSKIYAYVDAFPKSRKENEKFKKGDYFFMDESIWNLKSARLKPLIDFIDLAIKAS